MLIRSVRRREESQATFVGFQGPEAHRGSLAKQTKCESDHLSTSTSREGQQTERQVQCPNEE